VSNVGGGSSSHLCKYFWKELDVHPEQANTKQKNTEAKKHLLTQEFEIKFIVYSTTNLNPT
jgi:methylphosphotriester-DNA--protein-cysteine methyltransferase